MKKSGIFLLFVVFSITALSSIGHAQPVPLYIEDAFKKAALPADANGKWIVHADVNIHKPNGETLEGGGDLRLDGNVLVGYLALKVYEGHYIKDQTMWLSILKSQPIVVGIRHDIAGKPWLGRPAETARLKNLYTTLFSTGKVVWDGDECNVSIYLTPRQVRVESNVGIRKPPPKPIGARYKITGRIVIANAEDGLLDDTCEIYGQVWLRHRRNEKGEKISEEPRTLFKIIPQDVMKGMVFKFPNNLFFDIYDDDKSEYGIDGSFFDRDKGQGLTGDDLMWPNSDNSMRWDFRKYAGKGEYNYPGDRDSESVEVYITVEKVADLYKKP